MSNGSIRRRFKPHRPASRVQDIELIPGVTMSPGAGPLMMELIALHVRENGLLPRNSNMAAVLWALVREGVTCRHVAESMLQPRQASVPAQLPPPVDDLADL